MNKQGLLHKTKAGDYVVHRDADVGELRKAYDNLQKMKPVDQSTVSGFDKFRNKLNYVPLPGERGMLLGGMGLGVAGEVASKETAGGRKKSLAERLGRGAIQGTTEAVLAPLGVAQRLYGGLGMGAEMAGAFVPSIAGQAVDSALDARRAKAMQKKADAGEYFNSLPLHQRAVIARKMNNDATFNRDRLSLIPIKEQLNPFSIVDNYNKMKEYNLTAYDREAKRLFGKEASVPKQPRAVLKGLIK